MLVFEYSYGEPTEIVAEKLETQSKVSYGGPTEARTALALLKLMRTNGGPTAIAKGRSSYGEPTEIGAALDCSKLARTYGKADGTLGRKRKHAHPGSEALTVIRLRAENFGFQACQAGKDAFCLWTNL